MRSEALAPAGLVDATDRVAVEAHAAQLAGAAGGIDIAFNATSNDDLQAFLSST